MKKFLCVILSVLIVFTSLISMITVSSAASDGADIPVIHVSGYGALLVRNNSEGAKETVYPLQIPDGYIEETAEEFLPIFAKAFFTQEWTEFCDTLVDILVPVFSRLLLTATVKLPTEAESTGHRHVKHFETEKMLPVNTAQLHINSIMTGDLTLL